MHLPGMMRALTFIGIVLTLFCHRLAAQSARSYVCGSVGIARPQGALHDSLGLKQTVQFHLRYTWSPSRNLHLGIGGAWMTTSTGKGQRAHPPGADLSITQITATASWRPFKHGASPFIGVEGGFGFLIPSGELTDHPAFETALGASFGAHIGGAIPLSQLLELSMTGRWMRLATSTTLDLTAVSLGLTYRIQ